MKKLILIRHAKASHEMGYADFERPLKPSGMQDAAIMAARLREAGFMPEALVSSPALRTITTANIFSEHLSLQPASTDMRIYNAEEDTLLDVVNELPSQYNSMALIGHNPGISQLLYYYTGHMRDMETCAIAVIEFDLKHWSAVKRKSGKAIYYSTPGQ